MYVLHGLPGVRGIFTAKPVAEETRRLLYTVTRRELGIDPEPLDHNLEKRGVTRSIGVEVSPLDKTERRRVFSGENTTCQGGSN